jgi:hypothetical protein
MNISFQTITGQKADPNIASQGAEFQNRNKVFLNKAGSTGSSSYIANLDTSIFSNDAYGEHGKNAEDISTMAQNLDVKNQHNYMALLSNTLSEEDFAKACEDGFDIKNTNNAETVTILDKIKSVLLESGVEITGYNDDLTTEKLTRITGSQSFALAIQKSFHENDVPVTAENAKAAALAYGEISDISELDDSAVKYLVLNNMEPTIENIYFASHSTNGQNVSSRGYYAQEAGGYFAQKADSINWKQLEGQLNKIISEAGLDTSNEQVQKEAKWIVEQGIPLTADNLVKVDEINSISFPISEEFGAKTISAAILDGKRPNMANLADSDSSYEKARVIKEKTEAITEDDIKKTLESGKEINLRNLYNAQNAVDTTTEMSKDVQETKFVQARLQLEEVRLRMTIEANKQLLDSGFSIDTAPMEKLIERLKSVMAQMGDETAGDAVDEITGVTPASKGLIISATLTRVSTIANGPIDVTGVMADSLDSASLSEISATSSKIAIRYKRAGEEYETMMTKPRSDLGDSIKKAFRNVDDILEDLEIDKNEDTRRAVRILGYNNMEISKENIEKVSAWDQLVKTTVERLKPGAVLDLVRNGQNPLGMTIEELAENLDRNLMGGEENDNDGNRPADEKYSKFLYKLEHKKEISKEEKTSFIGIYRLFHTLKAGDYKAIGSVLKTGMDMTLGNLLTAQRSLSTAGRGMDYTVDDNFGGLGSAKRSSLKIDEQIETAFKYFSAKADIVYENLEPEKLLAAAPNEQTLLPELAQQLQSAELDEQLERDYYRQQVRQIRDTASLKAVDTAVDELATINAEITYNNIEAMISNRRDRRAEGLWRKTGDMIGEAAEKEQQLLVDALDQEGYEEIYKAGLSSISDKLSELLMSDDDSYIDVRSISLMQKQLSVMSYSSERGSFDVPIEIDGQKISMHVTLKNDDSMNSRMEASVQTYEYGLITASLYEKNGIISGMLTTTNGQSTEETEYLESVRSKMCVKLAERLRDFGVGQDKIAILYHAQTPPISVGAANANATDGNSKNITETRTLLAMAKAFIEAL